MPAQTTPNLDDLLRVLNAATDKSKLHWEKTAEEDTFRTEMGLGMIRISKTAGGPNYSLSLLDRNGILLDEYEPAEGGERSALEALYKKVRRQALNLDFQLQSVYDHLKRLAGEA
jgi:hypothetical protein